MTRFYVAAIAFVSFFLPAVTLGSIPLPIGYGLAAFYVLLRRPEIPLRQLVIFGITASYIAVIGAKNAATSGGDLRDFLYLFICFGQLVSFCAIKDLFDRGYGDNLLSAMISLALINLAIMMLQMFNAFGINQSLSGVWAIPWELVRRDDLVAMHAEEAGYRPFGMMNGFNIASTAMYLVFRAAWVRYDLVKYRVFSLFSVLVPSARMLTAFFIFYEVIVSLFSRRERKRAIAFLLVGAVVGSVALTFIAQYTKTFLLFSFFNEVSQGGINSNYSVTNRLDTLYWALDNIDKVLLFGGVQSNDFLRLSRATDSEFLLRSMQFGITGFALFVLMIYYYFSQYRSKDMVFLLAIMLWTSITFTGASNFQFTPFLLVYGFVCRDDYLRRREHDYLYVLPMPRGSANSPVMLR